jgi:hypothetical protein
MGRRLAPIIVTLALASGTSATAAAPSVTVSAGNVVYVDAAGARHALTSGGGYKEPALAPDGHTVAFIHVDGPATPSAAQDAPTSLWIADGLKGGARKLIGHHDSADIKQVFVSYGGPVFSLDGGFVYVTAQAWATSGAVHQVSLATGQEHFVIDGGCEAVIRTGPWRGYLLVQRHMYYPAPKYGSYDPTYVVRPDAKQSFIVPGTDKDDNVDHVTPWLKKNGWVAR